MCVVQARVRDTPRFNLHCRARAVRSRNSKEVHEGSVAVNTLSASTPPKFAFALASKPARISLLFVAMSSRQESTEKELGRCEGSLETTSTSQHSQTLLLSQNVKGTRMEKFAGKLTYTVRINKAIGTDFSSLLEEEAKRACVNVLPSGTPSINVLFHYVYTDVEASQQLVGIARIGDRSDIIVDTLLQTRDSGPQQLHHVPILKPVTLSCREFDCLEVHVADTTSGGVLFSSSRAVSRLSPFKPIHYSYDHQSLFRPTGGGAMTEQVDSRAPSVAVSVLYTPSLSDFNRFEGLEVAVCNISFPDAISKCRDVVLGTQLVQSDGKVKTVSFTGNSVQPPFQAPTAKGKAAASSVCQDYHVTVLQYHGKQLNTTMIKAYHFFPYSSKPSRDVNLVFHIYGSSGTHLWWSTENYTSAHLQISEGTLTLLQAGESPCFPWEINNKGHLTHQCKISGVMRWKSNKVPFFTESSLREGMLGTSELPPDTSTHKIPPNATRECTTSTEADNETEFLPHDPSPQPFNPASLQQTLEALVTPTQEVDTTEAKEGDSNVLSQLRDFESNLQHMVIHYRTLRKENQRLQGHNEQLVLQMAKLKSLVTVSPQKQSDLQRLSASDLILKIGSLQQRLEAEERAHERCQRRVLALQNGLSDKLDLERQHIVLQEAHTAQQKLVQLLRGKVTKYHKCSDICRKQESVITQLESLLTKQVEGHPPAKDDAILLLSKENAQLRALLQQHQTSRDHGQKQATLLQKDEEIRSLKSQLSRLTSQCQSLEQERVDCDMRIGEERESDTRMFELEQKLLVANAKLSAQTSQLQENARMWMSEKAHYELQLADFQSRLDSVIRSGQQALLTAHAVPDTSAPNAQESENDIQCRDSRHVQYHSSRRTTTKDFSF